jgi:hypothetical protein
MAVLAANLATLRREINARFPNRDKRSDGWIGDASHQARKSDHNPDGAGVVHALDLDSSDIPARQVVLQAIRHPTVEYVIFDRTIWSRRRGFRPRRYTGSNPHTAHLHVSGRHGREFEQNTAAWGIAAAPVPKKPGPAPQLLVGQSPGARTLRLTQPRMTGKDVAFVQRFIGPKRCGTADGVFGPNTESGVRFYQGMRGIAVTGVCDAATFRQMGVRV